MASSTPTLSSLTVVELSDAIRPAAHAHMEAIARLLGVTFSLGAPSAELDQSLYALLEWAKHGTAALAAGAKRTLTTLMLLVPENDLRPSVERRVVLLMRAAAGRLVLEARQPITTEELAALSGESVSTVRRQLVTGVLKQATLSRSETSDAARVSVERGTKIDAASARAWLASAGVAA